MHCRARETEQRILEKAESAASLLDPPPSLHRLGPCDARPWVDWSASLGEYRLRSLRVFMNEFTLSETRVHRDTRPSALAQVAKKNPIFAHHGGHVDCFPIFVFPYFPSVRFSNFSLILVFSHCFPCLLFFFFFLLPPPSQFETSSVLSALAAIHNTRRNQTTSPQKSRRNLPRTDDFGAIALQLQIMANSQFCRQFPQSKADAMRQDVTQVRRG